jgi:uncharacterized membrane protein
MPQQFIHPNWHVMIVHLPLALIGVGLLIEIFSFLWPRSSARAAGRWMLLLGALGCIPTVTLGLYAYRDVVAMGINTEDAKWHEVLAKSPWTDAQKMFMWRHIWLAAGASALFLVVGVVYLACSDRGRRSLYWPALGLFIVGFGLISAAAWYSGESVYTQSTAVTLARNPQAVPQSGGAPGAIPTAQPIPALEPSTMPTIGAAHDEHEQHEHMEHAQGKLEYYVPPLQFHVLLAGLTVALGFGAIGVTIRRWTAEPQVPARMAHAAQIERALDTADEVTRREHEEESIVVPTGAHTPPVVVPPPPLFPARIWVAALVFAVLTALAGVWMNADWRLETLIKPFKDVSQRHEIFRLWLHVLFGLSIVLFGILLALATRFARRQRGLTVFLMTLFGLAVAGQLWLGILLLYDSPAGPITGLAA